ncbi:MAG: hypothetical protein ACRCTI_03310, partial [Beijerinckiaceae bacterium]
PPEAAVAADEMASASMDSSEPAPDAQIDGEASVSEAPEAEPAPEDAAGLAAAAETPEAPAAPEATAVPAETSADAPATEAAPPPDVPAEPAEPELIEVWRPARFDRDHAHRGPRHGKGGDRRRGQRAGQPQVAAADGQPGEAAAQPQRDARPPRYSGKKTWQKRDGAADGERKFERKPREGDDRRGDDRRGRDARPPRREDRGPRQWSSAPAAAGRGKEPDPNSPFAQLAALKAKLEGEKS